MPAACTSKMTGSDVTECIGGSLKLAREDLGAQLSHALRSAAQRGQALDVAHAVASGFWPSVSRSTPTRHERSGSDFVRAHALPARAPAAPDRRHRSARRQVDVAPRLDPRRAGQRRDADQRSARRRGRASHRRRRARVRRGGRAARRGRMARARRRVAQPGGADRLRQQRHRRAAADGRGGRLPDRLRRLPATPRCSSRPMERVLAPLRDDGCADRRQYAAGDDPMAAGSRDQLRQREGVGAGEVGDPARRAARDRGGRGDRARAEPRPHREYAPRIRLRRGE